MRPDGTVFVVDSAAACRDSVCQLAGSVGLPAEAFACASEFLAAIDPARPGCLVLDLHIPRMNGLALQEYLMKIDAHIPIIFTSEHSDVATAVRAMKNGAVDFLQKPCPGSRLLDAIREGLRRDAARRSPTATGHQANAAQVASSTARTAN